MSKTRFVMTLIGSALLLGAMVTISEAQGTSGRDFISTNGVDTGTCDIAAPCRTIAFALTQLANNGELVFLNSGGYGPATITQGVTLSAEGVHASISAPSSSGLTINAPSQTVTVRGLTILGDGPMSSDDGITVTSVGTLYLQGLTIQSFRFSGVRLNGGNLFMQDSDVRGCFIGLLTQNNGTTAYVHNSNFSLNSAAGVEVLDGTSVTVAASSVFQNGSGFVSNANTTPNSMMLINDQVVGNVNGVTSSGAFSSAMLDHVLVTQNMTGIMVVSGGTMTGTNPGTSLIVGNTTNVTGTIGTATVLQ
jgi:hypothetical protein